MTSNRRRLPLFLIVAVAYCFNATLVFAQPNTKHPPPRPPHEQPPPKPPGTPALPTKPPEHRAPHQPDMPDDTRPVTPDLTLPVPLDDKPEPRADAMTVQEGDIVHVQGVPGGGARIDDNKRAWIVRVKLPSGKIVIVTFETAEKPPLKFCDWIKIDRIRADDPKGRTVIEDYEKTLPPPPPSDTASDDTPPPDEPSPPSDPQPADEDAVPPTEPQPADDPTPPTEPSPPPGEPTQPDKPKDEVAQPPPPPPPPTRRKPPDMPDWLEPWWEAAKYIVPGIVPTSLPDGKDALGLVLRRLRDLIQVEMRKGNWDKVEEYEKLHRELSDLYRRL